MNKQIGVLLVVLQLGVGAVFAAEGRKEIFKPVTLTGADGNGKFFVSRDIVSTGAVPFQVFGTGVEEVDLDLNGFKLTGPTGGIGVYVSNVRRFTVRNGTVDGGPGNSLAMLVQGLNGTDSRVVIEDVNLISNGIRIEKVASFAIRRAVLDQASSNGIKVEASESVNTTGVIEDCVIRDATNKAIWITTPPVGTPLDFYGIRIRNNDVNNGHIAVENTHRLLLEGNAVVGATVPSASRLSLSGVDGCHVIGNAVHSSSSVGIGLTSSTNCLLEDNVVSGSTDNHGIKLVGSSYNNLSGNVSNNNGGRGLFVDSTSNDNRLGRNSAVGNTGAGGCTTSASPACPTSNDFCDEGTGNVSYGDNLLPGPPPC